MAIEEIRLHVPSHYEVLWLRERLEPELRLEYPGVLINTYTTRDPRFQPQVYVHPTPAAANDPSDVAQRDVYERMLASLTLCALTSVQRSDIDAGIYHSVTRPNLIYRGK